MDRFDPRQFPIPDSGRFVRQPWETARLDSLKQAKWDATVRNFHRLDSLSNVVHLAAHHRYVHEAILFGGIAALAALAWVIWKYVR
jgi:hypothetical protein